MQFYAIANCIMIINVLCKTNCTKIMQNECNSMQNKYAYAEDIPFVQLDKAAPPPVKTELHPSPSAARRLAENIKSNVPAIRFLDAWELLSAFVFAFASLVFSVFLLVGWLLVLVLVALRHLADKPRKAIAEPAAPNETDEGPTASKVIINNIQINN